MYNFCIFISLEFMYRKSSFRSFPFRMSRQKELLIKTILSPKISKPNAFASSILYIHL